MAPWSPRRWIARHVGCAPEELRIVAKSDKAGTVLVTYRAPDGELVTVLAVLDGNRRRISARQRERWLTADVLAGRGLLW